MLSAQQAAQRKQARVVPPEFYKSQVDALFGDARSLFIGSVAACSVALITALWTGEFLLLAFGVAMGLLGIGRAIDMHAYARGRPALATEAAAHRWEMRYVIGASAHLALLGGFCLATFASTSDPFARLCSFGITMAYLVGTPGRNFASNRLVNVQILCAGLPMIAAMAVAGKEYWIVTLFVLLPLFLALKSISNRLRGIFLDAVIKAHDLSLLAMRFDTALNNMPHGLAMFDAREKLVVSNHRLAELLRLEPGVDQKGTSIAELLHDGSKLEIVHPSKSASIVESFQERLRQQSSADLQLETRSGRTLAFTFQAMENGGSVMLAEDITDRKNAEARITQLARYDSLTGLPNRTYFHDQAAAAIIADREAGKGVALLFIDLDHFKQINDTLGHTRGDILLCGVSDRLATAAAKGDIIGRFGGDEFVMLHPLANGRRDAADLASYIIELLSRPYEVDGHHVVVTTSVGIAFAPEDGTEVDQLLKNADMALYRAKSEGRGTWRFFEADMGVRARERRNLELDLRDALAHEAFELYYQPIYNLHTKGFSSCEALLRWKHPQRGLVSPAEFVPVAEEMGLIVEIGNWVLRQACLECAKWPSSMSVAVNISSMQFRRGSVVTAIRQALSAANLPAHRLDVEITETVLLQNLQLTRVILHQLRDIGVRIALDDFGTGYSSLSYLHSLPLNKVKIDRSFLQGLGANDRALVLLRGIARLSAELGMLVVVEGIETEDQFALVAAESNIDEIQGYLFSRPVPSRDVRLLLRPEAGAVRVA